jgi:hypothetical protein
MFIQYVGMFVICLHTKFHVHSSSAAFPNLFHPTNPFHGNISSPEPPTKIIQEVLGRTNLPTFPT